MQYTDPDLDYVERVFAIYERGAAVKDIGLYGVTFSLLILQGLFILCRERTLANGDLSGLQGLITIALGSGASSPRRDLQIRNSLAHHHFDFRHNNGKIEAIVLHDREKIPLELPANAVDRLIRDLHAYLLGLLTASRSKQPKQIRQSARSGRTKPNQAKRSKPKKGKR